MPEITDLNNPARDTTQPPTSGTETPTVARKLQVATGLTLEQATDLLDWLEVHALQPREVCTTPSGHVTVRWVS